MFEKNLLVFVQIIVLNYTIKALAENTASVKNSPNVFKYKNPVKYLKMMEKKMNETPLEMAIEKRNLDLSDPLQRYERSMEDILEKLIYKVEQLDKIPEQLHQLEDRFQVKTDYEIINEKRNANPALWSDWSEWSGCSVSCGKGREIRWRSCSKNCNQLESEMEEKICRMPPCKHDKVFGMF